MTVQIDQATPTKLIDTIAKDGLEEYLGFYEAKERLMGRVYYPNDFCDVVREYSNSLISRFGINCEIRDNFHIIPISYHINGYERFARNLGHNYANFENPKSDRFRLIAKEGLSCFWKTKPSDKYQYMVSRVGHEYSNYLRTVLETDTEAAVLRSFQTHRGFDLFNCTDEDEFLIKLMVNST